MLPWRNYFIMSLIMAVVIGFCVSLVITREKFNNYNENDFAVSYDKEFTSESVWNEKSASEFSGRRRRVLYLGDADKAPSGDTAKQWCVYSKRAFIQETRLDRLENYIENAEILLIDPDYISENDVSVLKQLSDKGMAMIFMKLPEVQRISDNAQLRELLGIDSVKSSECHLDGIRLFPHFLIGGSGEYIAADEDENERQDMQLDTVWYAVKAGTKVYMSGILDKEGIKNEDLPPLIWRTFSGNTMVFSVNGDYLDDVSGIGILGAMMSELHDCELYPIVNSQLFTILSGPDISSENNDEMEKLYGRNLKKTYRELVLPSLASISGMTDFPMNGMIMLKGDTEDGHKPEIETMIYYLKLFNEYRSEAGLSVVRKDNTPVTDTMNEYDSFFSQNQITYQFKGLYADEKYISEIDDILGGNAQNGVLSGINTVICSENKKYPLLGNIGGAATLQTVTNDGYRHNFSDDLRLKCFETALGYSNVSADMFCVTFPDVDSKHWEKLSNSLTSNLNSYWTPFKYFDRNTVSESDKRVRQFLKLDYSYKREKNVISVDTSNIEDKAWFILRTHGESISSMSGGSYSLMEDNAYLIEITDKSAEILLKSENELFYYY